MDYQKDRNVDIYGGREFSSKAEKFEFWMTNYFWYHFKWYVIIGLFIVVVLATWLVSSIVSVEYDWEVVYAHYGVSDAAKTQQVADYAQKLTRSVTGDKKAHVRVTELCMSDGAERLVMGALENYKYVLYFVDEETAQYYGDLGYFMESGGRRFAPVDSLGLMAALNDAEYKYHSADENEYSAYTEAELKDLNALLSQEHDAQVEQAAKIFEAIK